MWILRNDQKGLLYRVTPGKQLVVGRKDGDLVLQDDQSISRKHAQICVADDNASEGIIVKDLQSKYGTFTIIEEGELTQVQPNQQVQLKSDDCVRFGIQWNLWRAEYVPLLVATSTLSQEEKAEVRQLVAGLGGQVVNDWQDKCTHLTMNKLTLTVKVVCALAAGQPIVTPAYWRTFTEALDTLQTTLPSCKDFVPVLAEAMLNPAEVSFDPNPSRAKLFRGYTFVASSVKQVSRIKLMITAAGGNVTEFSSSCWTEEKLLKDKVILMQHSANDRQGSQQSQLPDGYIPAARKLKTHRVRCIPESEIGLSILYCSMTSYCNPHFHPQSLLGSGSTQENTQPVSVICHDSQGMSSSETSVASAASGPYSKCTLKKRCNEDDTGPVSKKPNTRQESEDIFSSQPVDLQNTQPNTRVHASMSKSLKSKKDAGSDTSSVAKETVQRPVLGPSLDMFAPSGEQSSKSAGSNAPNPSEVRPSCEDMFGTRSSRSSNSRKADELPSTSGKHSKNPPVRFEDDKFSFPCRRKVNNQQVKDVDDEFSFGSSKRCKETVEDEFSFASSRRPNKRNRQSDQDIFSSSVETPIGRIGSGAGPSRKTEVEDEFSFGESERNPPTSSDCPTKRKRLNDTCVSPDQSEQKVKIALFSTGNEADIEHSGLHVDTERGRAVDTAEEKQLVTYGKHMTTLTKIKEEVADGEMEELARALQNATIVIVKPLIPVRPTPPPVSSLTTVKNFKKFCKAARVNKRVVPHIIGGSDLVAHKREESELPDNFRPSSPLRQTPDDDWAFLGDKKKGRGR